jgi:hypothetical protein
MMNAKQSLKIVAGKLEDAEKVIKRASADILQYNRTIIAMIKGYSPCPWCEEFLECQKPEKTESHEGCEGWWLAFDVDKNMEAIPDAEDTADQESDAAGGVADGAGRGSDGDGTSGSEMPESPDADQSDAGDAP